MNQADKGSTIVITNPTILTVARLPHIDGRVTYIATLQGEDGRAAAIFKDATCAYDALKNSGKLGDDTLGVWTVHEKLDSLTAEITSAKHLFNPLVIASLKQIVEDGVARDCPPNPPGRIDWSRLPEGFTRQLGTITRLIIEGFQDGFRR